MFLLLSILIAGIIYVYMSYKKEMHIFNKTNKLCYMKIDIVYGAIADYIVIIVGIFFILIIILKTLEIADVA